MNERAAENIASTFSFTFLLRISLSFKERLQDNVRIQCVKTII